MSIWVAHCTIAVVLFTTAHLYPFIHTTDLFTVPTLAVPFGVCPALALCIPFSFSTSSCLVAFCFFDLVPHHQPITATVLYATLRHAMVWYGMVWFDRWTTTVLGWTTAWATWTTGTSSCFSCTCSSAVYTRCSFRRLSLWPWRLPPGWGSTRSMRCRLVAWWWVLRVGWWLIGTSQFVVVCFLSLHDWRRRNYVEAAKTALPAPL